MSNNDNQPSNDISENHVKTELTIKEVSNIIDETPHVIRNWLKDLKQHIPLQKNESGYNVFDEEALERMKLIKQLHRAQNYSIRQINHYFATDGESYKPTPSKGADELLADEFKSLKEEIQFLKDRSDQQEEFNKALIERLDQQQQYINNRLEERDQKLMESIRGIQEAKKEMLQIAATKEEERKRGFWARLFRS